jgi:transketolase
MSYNLKLLSMAGQGGSAFGVGLLDWIESHENLRVLSADMSTPAGLDKFKAAYPYRFYNVGIAEQNMIGVAAGLTDEGYKTISVAQACFISMRCFEQVRQYCGYMRSPQVLVGIGSGVYLQHMGNTHYALEDIALMRTIPGMQVIAPCDSLEAIKALNAAIDSSSPCYIRLFGGTNVPAVYKEDYDFKIGKSVKFGDGNAVQIIATGSMVSVALSVADRLNSEGVSTYVTNMHTIKPLDESAIDLNVKLVVSVEEHHTIGGLGDAVAGYLSSFPNHPRHLKIGVSDSFIPVGSYQYILDQCGLSSDKIIEQILNIIK